MTVASPCVKVCKLDGHGFCLGCFRSLAEIARWSNLDEIEKSRVIALLDGRRKEFTQDNRDQNQ